MTVARMDATMSLDRLKWVIPINTQHITSANIESTLSAVVLPLIILNTLHTGMRAA